MTTTSNKHIDFIEVTFSASHGKGVTVDDCISQSSIAISQIMATLGKTNMSSISLSMFLIEMRRLETN